MDFLAIRQALSNVVEQVTGTCYPFPVKSPNPPCAVIAPAEGQFINYLLAYRPGGLAEINLRIILLAEISDDEGTRKISKWLSTGNTESLFDAVMLDKTLGGVVGNLVVRSAENAGWVEIPPGSNNWFATAEIVVDITLQ